MTLPFYQGLTLGGILTTGSHGTGDRVLGTLGESLVSATLVNAKVGRRRARALLLCGAGTRGRPATRVQTSTQLLSWGHPDHRHSTPNPTLACGL